MKREFCNEVTIAEELYSPQYDEIMGKSQCSTSMVSMLRLRRSEEYYYRENGPKKGKFAFITLVSRSSSSKSSKEGEMMRTYSSASYPLHSA